MGHTIVLSEEMYRVLITLAAHRGETPEQVVESLIVQQAQELTVTERNPVRDPRYFAPDEFLQHLGMSDEMIRKADELAVLDAEDADADV